MISIGSTIKHTPAKIIDQSLKYMPWKLDRVTVRVSLFLLCRNSMGIRKSFQIEKVFSTATVDKEPFKSGKTILKNVRYIPAPSIYAASSSSPGMDFIKPVNKKMEKGARVAR